MNNIYRVKKHMNIQTGTALKHLNPGSIRPQRHWTLQHTCSMFAQRLARCIHLWGWGDELSYSKIQQRLAISLGDLRHRFFQVREIRRWKVCRLVTHPDKAKIVPKNKLRVKICFGSVSRGASCGTLTVWFTTRLTNKYDSFAKRRAAQEEFTRIFLKVWFSSTSGLLFFWFQT